MAARNTLSNLASKSRSHDNGIDATPGNAVGSIATEYGDLILDRICASPFVVPRDLIPLRGVAKRYRDLVDVKLVPHVTISRSHHNKSHILSADQKRIPGFIPTKYADQTKRRVHSKSSSRLIGTTVVDINHAFRLDLLHLQRFLENVHTVRLTSDLMGLHTYNPPVIGRSDITMVVFPSFVPSVPEHTIFTHRTVPDNVTTLVQHLSSTFDVSPLHSMFRPGGRGPVLFKERGPNVKQEVWVFTHWVPKVDLGRVGLYDDRVYDAMDDLMEELVAVTAARLESPVRLTLVDGDEKFANLVKAFQAYFRPDGKYNPDPSRQEAEEAIRARISKGGAENVDKLRLMTWDEYASTLSSEQNFLQTLPDSYIQSMETVPDGLLPRLCESCRVIHDDGEMFCF